jgi:rhodanese-related sulfurtransferase
MQLIKAKRRHFLLDVREYDEFKQWSTEGSENIPISQVSSALNEIPKTMKLSLFCPQGNRAGMVLLSY